MTWGTTSLILSTSYCIYTFENWDFEQKKSWRWMVHMIFLFKQVMLYNFPGLYGLVSTSMAGCQNIHQFFVWGMCRVGGSWIEGKGRKLHGFKCFGPFFFQIHIMNFHDVFLVFVIPKKFRFIVVEMRLELYFFFVMLPCICFLVSCWDSWLSPFFLNHCNGVRALAWSAFEVV